MNFEFFIKIRKNIISRVQLIFYIVSPECPFHTRGVQLTSLFYYFRTTKVNRSTKSVIFISKIVIKKKDHQKKILKLGHLIIDQFYLLISLEGMTSFLRRVITYLVKFWDVHLHNE